MVWLTAAKQLVLCSQQLHVLPESKDLCALQVQDAIGQETPLLSNANDAPRMYVNIEDHLTHQTGVENVQFQVLFGPLFLLCKSACLSRFWQYISSFDSCL